MNKCMNERINERKKEKKLQINKLILINCENKRKVRMK